MLTRQLEEEAPRHTDERRQHPESHARNEHGILHLERDSERDEQMVDVVQDGADRQDGEGEFHE